jgi:hypothetical protein
MLMVDGHLCVVYDVRSDFRATTLGNGVMEMLN